MCESGNVTKSVVVIVVQRRSVVKILQQKTTTGQPQHKTTHCQQQPQELLQRHKIVGRGSSGPRLSLSIRLAGTAPPANTTKRVSPPRFTAVGRGTGSAETIFKATWYQIYSKYNDDNDYKTRRPQGKLQLENFHDQEQGQHRHHQHERRTAPAGHCYPTRYLSSSSRPTDERTIFFSYTADKTSTINVECDHRHQITNHTAFTRTDTHTHTFTALSKGVNPSSSLARTSAPFSTSSRTTASCPPCAATIREVTSSRCASSPIGSSPPSAIVWASCNEKHNKR